MRRGLSPLQSLFCDSLHPNLPIACGSFQGASKKDVRSLVLHTSRDTQTRSKVLDQKHTRTDPVKAAAFHP
jgi:hypothetical protein